MSLSPGELTSFRLVAFDELGNKVHSVAKASSIAWYENGTTAPSFIRLVDRFYVLAPFNEDAKETLSFLMDDNDYKNHLNEKSVKHGIRFADRYSSFDASVVLHFTPVKCRPGFVFDVSTKSCKCDRGQNWFLIR